MNKGKKKCPKCGKLFSPQGIRKHTEACKGRKGRDGFPRPAKKRRKAKPKERFIIFDRDQEWFSEASSLKQVEELASEMLENDVDPDDISVYKVVEQYSVEKVKKAILTPKKK